MIKQFLEYLNHHCLPLELQLISFFKLIELC